MSILDVDIILAEILPRLPVKSLVRFKCVSKSFNSTISSRQFTKLYLRYQSLSSDDNNLLVLPGNRRINCYHLDSSSVTATFAWDKHDSVSVVGSYNGLLCILTRSLIDYLTVLNPTTRIYQDIHLPDNERRCYNLGFAFDHENIDFKIVVVSDQHNKAAVKTRVTKVHSLNANSWKVVEITMPVDSMEERHGGVLINNNLLHWMFWSPSLRKRRIGCFDVCKMKWTDYVLLPFYYYDPDQMNYLLDFGVFDGCLYSSFENRVDSCFDVWVMRVYGVQDSWVKLFSIDTSLIFLGGVVPVAYRGGSDDILIRKRHSCKLFWYNRTDAGTSEAKFDEAPDFSNLQAYMCSTTPIELPGGKLFKNR